MLDRLRAVKWFSRCGSKGSHEALHLASWEDAISHASSPAWEDIRLEAANTLRDKLGNVGKGLLNSWNDRVTAVKPLSEALVAEKALEFPMPDIANSLRVEAGWDILHLCMECEYLDHIDPGFYHSLAFFYDSGHFPCGIDGDPATGRMIVF